MGSLEKSSWWGSSCCITNFFWKDTDSDEKQMAFIFAGSYLTTSDTMKELSQAPPKVAEYMNLYIQKELNLLEQDLNPPVKENK